MAEWTRTTRWRQGSVVPLEAARALGVGPLADDAVVVVISHDCDLLQLPNVEPHVEVICGRRVATLDGQFAHGRSPRTLHLPFMTPEGDVVVSLTAPDRHRLPKFDGGRGLAETDPLAGWQLTPAARRDLRHWLAARYNRHAFPDAFEEALRASGLRERLPKVFSETGRAVAAVYFDIDGGSPRDHAAADDPYALRIFLVYATDTDPTQAKALADTAKQKIIQLFETRCREPGDHPGRGWKWVELEGVEVVAATSITLAQASILTRWSAEYISYRADPEQPTLGE
jgi:hypothetical protein